MDRHPKRWKKAPTGFWLAVVAVAGQVLLPFLLAFEIALLSPGIDAYFGTPICSALHQGESPATPGNGGNDEHGSLASCPICMAAAAGQSFTQPTDIPLPVPTLWIAISLCSTASQRPSISIAAAPYQSRAPPSSV